MPSRHRGPAWAEGPAMKALPVVAALLLWVVATTAAAEQAWYLMSPPGNHLTFEVFDNAPLHHWIKLEAFDTELTCQVRRRLHIEWQADWMIPLIGKPEWPLQESFLQAMLASRCVPANDPRLFAAPAAKPPKVAVAPRQTYTPLADDVGTIRYT